MKRKAYIPVPEENYRIFTQFDKPYWAERRRVPIEDIKIDKSLMSYPNPVYEETVQIILEHFDLDQWWPVMINEDGFLLDGQHRLEVAKRLHLQFIDTVVRNEDLFRPENARHTRKRKILS